MSRRLQISALWCILPTALVTGAIAQILVSRLDLGPAYLPKVLLVFAMGAALVLIGLRNYHGFATFGRANQVTVVRGALVALLAGLIGEPGAAIAAFAVAAASAVAVLDGVDGALAR